MKSLKLTIGTLIVAVFALTSCGNRNSGTSTPSSGFDAFGNPIGGGSGYIGRGSWQGTMTVSDPNLYRQMLYQNQMCMGYQACNYVSNWLFLSLSLDTEWLPGPGTMSLRTYANGGWSGGRTVRTDAYAIGSNGYNSASGFQMIRSQYPMMMGGMTNYINPQQPQVPQQVNTSIQIIATFADQSRTLVNAQVLYQGRQVATGILRGQLFGGGVCNGIYGCFGMQGGMTGSYF